MDERNLVVGRVGDDRRIWIGVEGDEKAYDRLEGPLSGRVTHALVIGDEISAGKLAQMLIDELKDEDAALQAVAAARRTPQCDGSSKCAANEHIHGCFADVRRTEEG